MGIMQNMVNAQQEKQQEVENKLQKVVQAHCDNPQKFVIGVAQIETKDNSWKAVAAKVVANTEIMNYKDYLLAVDAGSKTFYAFELGQEPPVKIDLSDLA